MKDRHYAILLWSIFLVPLAAAFLIGKADAYLFGAVFTFLPLFIYSMSDGYQKKVYRSFKRDAID